MRVREFRLQNATKDLINAFHWRIMGMKSVPLNRFGLFLFFFKNNKKVSVEFCFCFQEGEMPQILQCASFPTYQLLMT